ncbi:uncharacterized protein V1510DRAFT_421733 [Dipodascopsis tothii]|uniref:uncharacterized protein n=1 Tax=Dipodascopsis tothii TaxID=44089 RepID=UPI0034CF44C0
MGSRQLVPSDTANARAALRTRHDANVPNTAVVSRSRGSSGSPARYAVSSTACVASWPTAIRDRALMVSSLGGPRPWPLHIGADARYARGRPKWLQPGGAAWPLCVCPGRWLAHRCGVAPSEPELHGCSCTDGLPGLADHTAEDACAAALPPRRLCPCGAVVCGAWVWPGRRHKDRCRVGAKHRPALIDDIPRLPGRCSGLCGRAWPGHGSLAARPESEAKRAYSRI